MYFAYVLLSLKDGKRYYGCTENLDRRIKDHNAGLVKSTKNRRPLKVICGKSYCQFNLLR